MPHLSFSGEGGGLEPPPHDVHIARISPICYIIHYYMVIYNILYEKCQAIMEINHDLRGLDSIEYIILFSVLTGMLYGDTLFHATPEDSSV